MKRIVLFIFIVQGFDIGLYASTIQSYPEFEKSYQTLVAQFSKKCDSLSYRNYCILSQDVLQYIQQHNISKKYEKVLTIAKISDVQDDYDLMLSSNEYLVQLPEVKQEADYPIRYYELGNLLVIFENYPKAMYYFNLYIRTINARRNLKYSNTYWRCYRELGFVYYQLENYALALKCYQQFYNSVKGRDYFFEPSTLNDIGQCYRELGQKDSAQKYFNLAIRRMEEYHRQPTTDKKYIYYFKPIVEASNFQYCIDDKNYKRAIKLGFREIEGGKVENDLGAISRGYYKIFQSYYYLNQWDSAYQYFYKFEKSIQFRPNTKVYYMALKYKLKMDLKKKNYSESIATWDKINHIDSILSKKDKDIKNEFVFRTNLELKEEEIESKTKTIQLQKRIVQNSNIAIVIISLLLLSSIVLLIQFVLNRNKIKRQADIIEKEYEKQKILLKEIHHRVKNNLQLISSYLQLQLSRTDVNSDMALQDSIKNIETIALVHENLYKKNNIDEVNVRTYIEALSQNTLNISHHNDISLRLKIDEIYLDIDRAISIGLIINELITNSVKYAFGGKTGEIIIDIKQINSVLKMSYKDNGKGVSQEILTKNKSIGIRMIESIAAEDLQGSYRYQLDKGFGFEMEFKLNSNQQE